MEFTIEGKVINGNKIGRKIGFPTANILISDDNECQNGVYAAQVIVDGQKYNAMAYVGYKFSVGVGKKRVIELYIFDFDRDIYGQTINATLTHYVRPEQKIGSLEELQKLLEQDKIKIEKLLQHVD